MHVKYSTRLIKLTVIAGLYWMGIIFGPDAQRLPDACLGHFRTADHAAIAGESDRHLRQARARRTHGLVPHRCSRARTRPRRQRRPWRPPAAHTALRRALGRVDGRSRRVARTGNAPGKPRHLIHRFREHTGPSVAIGACRLRIGGETRPCEQMEEAAAGLQQAMGRRWSGGGTRK